MTAPQQPAPPSRFSTDLVTGALVALVFLCAAACFVLTQQHEPIPEWLSGLLATALVGLGLYRASSPAQLSSAAAINGLTAQQADQHAENTGRIADLERTVSDLAATALPAAAHATETVEKAIDAGAITWPTTATTTVSSAAQPTAPTVAAGPDTSANWGAGTQQPPHPLVP
jgi:hypothetical protein